MRTGDKLAEFISFGSIMATFHWHPTKSGYISSFCTPLTFHDIKFHNVPFSNATEKLPRFVSMNSCSVNKDIFFDVISVYEFIIILESETFDCPVHGLLPQAFLPNSEFGTWRYLRMSHFQTRSLQVIILGRPWSLWFSAISK